MLEVKGLFRSEEITVSGLIEDIDEINDALEMDQLAMKELLKVVTTGMEVTCISNDLVTVEDSVMNVEDESVTVSPFDIVAEDWVPSVDQLTNNSV